MSETAHDQSSGGSAFSRIFKNVAWLLGGKGFGAVCSIAYLAILSRTLGLKDFGHFSLIFATGSALVAIAGFQTWQTVIRYGSEYVHRKDWAKFGRLSTLCGALDAIGALTGCLIAYLVFYRFSGFLELNPAYIDSGFFFVCALLWARVSAPTGILRALDRFDLAIYVEAIVPIGRLAAALAIWLSGAASVNAFLIAWAVIDLTCAVSYWVIALRQLPHGANMAALGEWRTTLAENTGIGRFLMIVSAGSTLDAVYKQGPLLAVGYLMGTSAAGLYRLAEQLAQGFGKVSVLLARAVYPEISRVQVASSTASFGKVVARISLAAGMAGVVVVGVAIAWGGQLLALLGGDSFSAGYVVLIPLSLAASFDLASVAFEPLLHTTGRARLWLAAKLVTIGALAAAVLQLQNMGAEGVAWAVAAAGATGYLTMGIMSLLTLKRMERDSQAQPG